MGQIVSAGEGCSYGRHSVRNDLAPEEVYTAANCGGEKNWPTVFLRFIVVQYVILTTLVVLTVELFISSILGCHAGVRVLC
jgi:hypothetical protein